MFRLNFIVKILGSLSLMLIIQCGDKTQPEDKSDVPTLMPDTQTQPQSEHTPNNDTLTSASIKTSDSTIVKTTAQTTKTLKPSPKNPPKEKTLPAAKGTKPSPQKMAHLKILSSPAFANITLNGSNLGTTPMKAYHKVTPGSHLIKLDHRRNGTLDSTVILKGGDSLVVKLKFPQE